MVVPTAWWHSTCNLHAYTASVSQQDVCDVGLCASLGEPPTSDVGGGTRRGADSEEPVAGPIAPANHTFCRVGALAPRCHRTDADTLADTGRVHLNRYDVSDGERRATDTVLFVTEHAARRCASCYDRFFV